MQQWIKPSILPAVLILCAAWSASHAGEPLDLPTGQRQLFLDDQGIKRIENLTRTMHQPEKKGAVVRPTSPSETVYQTRCAPAWDPVAKRWKILIINSGDYSGTAYAQSTDGLHWTKPNLGQVEVNGSRENNYITIDESLGWPANAIINVVIDPDDPDPARRFKGLGHAWGREPVVSADGINWKKLDVPSIKSGDESNLTYDRLTRTFFATVKTSGRFGRAHALTTSKDFETWTEPKLMFEADELDQELGRKHIAARFADASLHQPVANDPSRYNVDVYNIGVFRYESMYIGLPAMYHATGPAASGSNTDGFHLVQLAAGRDLEKLQRLGDRQTFIGPSPVGGSFFDLTQILPPSDAVVRDEELWFYYTGIKYRRRPENVPQHNVGAICLAVLRRDGFISLDAGGQRGTIQTEVFTMPGTSLFLNVDARKGGIRVEALNGNDKVVASSKPMTGDLLHEQVKWAKGDIADSKGQTASLRFTPRNAQLYSYWVQ